MRKKKNRKEDCLRRRYLFSDINVEKWTTDGCKVIYGNESCSSDGIMNIIWAGIKFIYKCIVSEH